MLHTVHFIRFSSIIPLVYYISCFAFVTSLPRSNTIRALCERCWLAPQRSWLTLFSVSSLHMWMADPEKRVRSSICIWGSGVLSHTHTHTQVYIFVICQRRLIKIVIYKSLPFFRACCYIFIHICYNAHFYCSF